ncbi:MAG: nicotinamide mononucleotide transporter family protein [Bifidobacteriaceae bacterium]|jgi:hypothetical protein|nr:nicotinamide mononucleotide transporter family protein [Bifidobacteriaceae bacterium]
MNNIVKTKGFENAYKIFSSKKYDATFLIVGIALVIGAASLKFNPTSIDSYLSLFSGIGGMFVVIMQANRIGRPMFIAAILVTACDFYNYFKQEIMAKMILAIYGILLNFIGLFTYKSKIEVTKLKKTDLIITSIVGAIGVVVLVFFGKGLMKSGQPAFVFPLTVVLFVVQVCAKFLFIRGKALCGILFFIANFGYIIIYAALLLTVGKVQNYVYFAMYIMFTINAIKATVIWYHDEDKEN